MEETRHHGWYWWEGEAPEKNVFGHQYTAKSNWVVKCWTFKGEGYASSANWREPMRQLDMTENGVWGPQVIWDKTKKDIQQVPICLDSILKKVNQSNIGQYWIDGVPNYEEWGYQNQD